jgi:hypothetical protein
MTDQEKIDELVAALKPEDRLNAGRVIFDGYKPENVVDLIQCLGIWLHQELARVGNVDHRTTRKIKREIKREIDRLGNQCSRAIGEASR